MWQKRVERNQHLVHSIKARADSQRTTTEKIADWVTSKLGKMAFLFLNVLWFVVWVSWNLEWIPGAKAFDPFPFGFLTMIVSLEAIALSIIVLISQNREQRINEIREEIDLQVNAIAESEITKVLHLLTRLMEHNGMKVKQDKDLQKMLEPVTIEEIEASLKQEISHLD